jgi:hypothetical protein
MDGKRSFTVSESSIGFSGGRYISKTPEAAAKKAGRQLFRKKGAASLRAKAPKITFVITETTREKGGVRRTEPRKYTVTRVQKAVPDVFVRGGVKIIVNYDYKVTSSGLA